MEETKKSSEAEAELKPAQESQRFLGEFIDAYHSYSCLWKYSCKDYRNREVKDQAYEALAEKMREIDPRADKNSVMRKINALRTAFRREYKKVRKAGMQAHTAGPRSRLRNYVPSLWYYDLLKFVVEQQDFSEPAPGALITEWPAEPLSPPAYTSVDEDGKIVNHNAETFMEYLEDAPSMQVIKLEPSSPTTSRSTTPSTQVVSANSSTPGLGLEINSVYSEKSSSNAPASSAKRAEPAMPSRKRRLPQPEEPSAEEQSEKAGPSAMPGARAAAAEQQQLAAQRARRPQAEPADADGASNLDRFGDYVVAKLKKSSSKQCIIAEKIIAEVLMRANLGILDEGTTLTDIRGSNSHSF